MMIMENPYQRLRTYRGSCYIVLNVRRVTLRLGPLVKGLPGWKPHHKSEITIKFFCFFHSSLVYNVIYYGMQNLPCKCVFTFIGPWKQKCFDELLWFTMCYFSSKNEKNAQNYVNYKKKYMLRGNWPKLLPCKWSHLLTLENKYFDELLQLLNVLF